MKPDEIEGFKAQVEEKIQNLLVEFSGGGLSLAQFNAVYERYNGQLAIANIALESGDADALNEALQGPPTVAVREKYMGKALGMEIYHRETNALIETLGSFEIERGIVTPLFEDFRQKLADDKLTGDHMDVQLSDMRWLVFFAGYWTHVVTVFKNEPSALQIREIKRLHSDFEEANRDMLRSDAIEADKLAYPFLVFIQKTLG